MQEHGMKMMVEFVKFEILWEFPNKIYNEWKILWYWFKEFLAFECKYNITLITCFDIYIINIFKSDYIYTQILENIWIITI